MSDEERKTPDLKPMKTISIGRAIATVIAVTFIAAGFFLLYGAYQLWDVFHAQFEDRQLEMTVDLSQPNEFTGTLRQKTWPCMGQFFSIHLPEEDVAGISPDSLIESLEFDYEILDSQGEEIASGSHDTLPHWTKENEPESHDIPIIHVRAFGPVVEARAVVPAEYTFNIRVLKGAPKLAGLEQKLVCQVVPCSVELQGTIIIALLSAAAFALGGIILYSVRRAVKGQANETDVQGAASDKA